MLIVVSAKSDITGVDMLDYDGRVCMSTKANATTDRMSTVVGQGIGIAKEFTGKIKTCFSDEVYQADSLQPCVVSGSSFHYRRQHADARAKRN